MKLRELIEELSQVNPELEVVIARDEEGNGFHLFSDWSYGTLVPDGDYDDMFSSWDEDENEVTAEKATAICFWP